MRTTVHPLPIGEILVRRVGRPDRHHIVIQRQNLLDELERRNPSGFGRWLDTGTRAGSDPDRYLTSELR